MISNCDFRNITCVVFLTATIVISGCTQNVREQSSDAIADSVTHGSRGSYPDLAWFAPELRISHYRTLFYGYDTVDYRLAASKDPENKSIPGYRLLVDAHYGGNPRHYTTAKMPDASGREVNHQQHEAERCQIFNSMISSCLYRDRFSLKLSRQELEFGQSNGLKIVLRSATQDFETLDLPSNYIQGFLKALTVSGKASKNN